MAFQKIKITFVILIMVYLCAWGLKQHVLRDKHTKGENLGDAPRNLRRAQNASQTARGPQTSLNISTQPMLEKPAANDRINGSKAHRNIRESEAIVWRFEHVLSRLVEKNKQAWSDVVSRNKVARREWHETVQDVFRTISGKKESGAQLGRRRSKFASGLENENVMRSGEHEPITNNDEGHFRSDRYWSHAGVEKCLTPSLYRHLRGGIKAIRLEGLKLMGAILFDCGGEFEGQRALPFVHILGRSSRALRRAWVFLIWMRRQERGKGLDTQMYLERIQQLNNMLNILNKMKGFLIRWSESLRQNLALCFQCLPVWLHYIDLALTEPHLADFLLNPKTSRNLSLSSSFTSTSPPSSKLLFEPEEHLSSSPLMEALLVKMTVLLNDQDRRVRGLNSSLYGLQRSISTTTHAHDESRFRSLQRYFNSLILSLHLKSYFDTNSRVQRNVSNNFSKKESFCQKLIHNLDDAIQTTKYWINKVREYIVSGVKFLCDQLLALQNKGISKWLTSYYNHFQIELFRLLINKNKESGMDESSDYDTTNVADQEFTGQFKLNKSTGAIGAINLSRSTIDIGSKESRNVISLAVESRLDTIEPNATASDTLSNGTVGFDVVNKTKTYSNISLRRTHSDDPVLNKSDVRQNGGLNKPNNFSTFRKGEAKSNKDNSIRMQVKDVIKIWIKSLIILKYVGEPVRNNNGISTETETQMVNSPRSLNAKNVTFQDNTWRLAVARNIQTSKFQRLPRKGVKSGIKEDPLAKPFTFLRHHRVSNVTEPRSSFDTLSGYKMHKHRRRVNDLNGLVELWRLKARQMSQFLTWLVLLPHRTLSFIRRIELANLKLRMVFFRRVFQIQSDSRQRGHMDDKTERLGKAVQREAFRNHKMSKYVGKTDEKQAKPGMVWKLDIYKIEDTKTNNKTNQTTDGAQVNSTLLRHWERLSHFNHTKHSSPTPVRNVHNFSGSDVVKTNDRPEPSSTDVDVLDFNINEERKRFKRHVPLKRKRRSPSATGEDEALKKQMKKLHRIANNHKKNDLVMSGEHIKGSPPRKLPNLKKNSNRPHFYSKVDADALRSKLLNILNLVDFQKNDTSFSNVPRVTKGPYSRGIYLDNIDDYEQKTDDLSEDSQSNFGETTEDLLSNAINGEPTEADFELLKNIETLTKKFLGKRNKKIPTDHLGHLIKPRDHSGSKRRRKRSEDSDEGTAEELGETPESDQLKQTGPDDKVKESRQFLQKWASLRKQAQNLQTEVNSARDKYASTSDELALLLKKGNTLHDKVASASSADGVHKSMLEENWKNVNKEFDKYKSDMAAREREIQSEDKRVNAEKIDQTLLRLEDAISEQGDPNDRILGDTAILPFNAKLDRLSPALNNMKNEAFLSGQIASDEVMLESEDAEDDVFKQSEAGDYSIVDFDYGPDAKFVDEEDSDIAEDAESLTGFDYEIDRHSDAQLEDVDNMLSKLIARRFRSKRNSGMHVWHGVEKTSASRGFTNISYFTKRNQTLLKTPGENKNTWHGASGLRHPVKREVSPEEIKQTLNSADGENVEYEEQSDISDELKDIEGGRIVDETNELTADNNLDSIFRFNLSNPKLRANANRLIDVAANKEAKAVNRKKSARGNNKKVGKFKSASDLLGYDSSELGVDSKQLTESVRHRNDMGAIPLGSDVDIENGIAEIRREKEFLTAADEKVDEDIPSNDELKPFDQVINESLKEFSDGDFGGTKDDTWKQKANLETAQLKLIDADEEKEIMELSASSETQRQRERFQHRSDLVELDAINKGLDKAYMNLDQATKDVHRPPPRPSENVQVISLYGDDFKDIQKEDEWSGEGSETLRRNRRSIDKKRRRNIEKFGLAKDATIEPHYMSRKGTKLRGFKDSADPNREKEASASSRVERAANPPMDEDESEIAAAEGSIDGDLDEEVEDESMNTEVYNDDVLYEDGDSLAEEWEMKKTRPPKKKPKKIVNAGVEGIQGQLLDAKSVVRQLKEEEDVAGHLLPPSSLVHSEEDLMEFGRKPDAKDMFLNMLHPVGLAELSDDEVNELRGPVLSSTDIEKALDNPTALVSALEGIEDEIKSTKHSVLAQTLDISRLGGTGSDDINSVGESAEEVIHQIGAADEMGSSLLERKAFSEGMDALDDAQRTRLTQNLLDEQEERDSELMDGGNALGEALQDLDQYKVDKDMMQLRQFISFKDVLQKKKAKTPK